MPNMNAEHRERLAIDERLEAAGFTSVDVRSNRFIWACHARRPA